MKWDAYHGYHKPGYLLRIIPPLTSLWTFWLSTEQILTYQLPSHVLPTWLTRNDVLVTSSQVFLEGEGGGGRGGRARFILWSKMKLTFETNLNRNLIVVSIILYMCPMSPPPMNSFSSFTPMTQTLHQTPHPTCTHVYTNNDHHPYMDSTTMLFDTVCMVWHSW